MNKKFLTMAAAAMMFAACSDNLTIDQEVPEVAQNTEATEVPVTFGAAYVNRATTRAGLTGKLTSGTANWDATNSEWNGIEKSGFGVFGYYTNGELYTPEAFQPNFMYNQRVYNTNTDGNEITWQYEPVKYWPNEFGISAVSDEVDRVSFFAYAPYVSTTTGGVLNGNGSTYAEDDKNATTGIIGLSRNTALSDPYVKYAISLDPSKVVDLTYGVAGQAFSREGLDAVSVGQNLVDLSKPGVGSKVVFDFKHALAALNVQIDAVVDTPDNVEIGTMADGTTVENSGATKTRVYVRSISFEGMAEKGMLNLRDHAWYDLATGMSGVDGVLTVNDGRSDGREAVMSAINEKNVAFNADIIQKGVSTNPGVTKTAVNLFQPATPFADPSNPTDEELAARLAEPIYVIPTGQQLRVTIVYDVETEDASLPGYLSGSTTHGISVQNAITQTIDGITSLAAGHFYTLKLHLDLNSVKFEVNEVTEWPSATVNPGNIHEAETNLPTYATGTLDDLKNILNGTTSSELTIDQLKEMYVGKFVDAQGNISATNTDAVGSIIYLAQANNEIDSNAELASARIVVMANEDAPITIAGTEYTSFPWFNLGTAANSTINATSYPQFYGDYKQVASVPTVDKTNTFADWTQGGSKLADNSTNYATNALAGYDISKAYSGVTDFDKFYAIYAAYNFDAGVDGATAGYGLAGQSGAVGHWFLPTVKQTIDLMGAANYRYSASTTGDTSLESGPMAPLTGYYWSSSEYNATYAWRYNASSGYWYNNYRLSYINKVRPIFAY